MGGIALVFIRSAEQRLRRKFLRKRYSKKEREAYNRSYNQINAAIMSLVDDRYTEADAAIMSLVEEGEREITAGRKHKPATSRTYTKNERLQRNFLRKMYPKEVYGACMRRFDEINDIIDGLIKEELREIEQAIRLGRKWQHHWV